MRIYRCFYRKLTAVIYMSNQRFYCKLMTLALIICSGDIEINPGPKKNTKVPFCQWNLNGVAANNFSKLSLLQAMATHMVTILYVRRKHFPILGLTHLMTELI